MLESQLKACYKNSKKHLTDAGVLGEGDSSRLLTSASRSIVSCSLLSRPCSDTFRVLSIQMKDRRSQLRGEVKTKADQFTPGAYGLILLSKVQVAKRVKMLTTKSAFTYADPENVSVLYFCCTVTDHTRQRKGSYHNAVFKSIIAEQWLSVGKKSCEGVGDYHAKFNPIPKALIALVAAAVECVLASYATGAHNKKDHTFNGEQYAKVYRRHLKNLNKFETKAPAGFLKLCRDLWAEAWQVCLVLPLAS